METKKSVNEFSETVLNCDDAIHLLLTGRDVDGIHVTDSEELELYNSNAEQILHKATELNTPTNGVSIEAYHKEKINTWFIPDKYKTIDIEDYVVDKCETQFEIDRAMVELNMYEERGLEDVLRFLIFLVDYLRENDIVWGVGRGSSVSSYVLYLLGVHKINSLQYKLDITDFLK